MSCWAFLNIEPTVDTRLIKRAYAKLLQDCHPEDDPVAFQDLRLAFEEALRQSKYIDPASGAQAATDTGRGAFSGSEGAEQHGPQSSTGHEQNSAQFSGSVPDIIVQQCMSTIEVLYNDFPNRLDLGQWEDIFEPLLMWPVDARIMLGFQLFGFLGHNPWVPPQVWAMAEEHFAWSELQSELYQKYPQELVDAALWRVRNHRWALRFDSIPPDREIDYNAYLYERECVAQAVAYREIEKAKRSLNHACSMLQDDPELQRLAIEVHVQADETSAALAQSERLTRNHPDQIEGFLNLAHLLLSENKTSEALTAFQRALQLYPNDVEALNGLARCHISMENLLEAQNLFEQVLDLCPDHVEAHVELLRVCQLLTQKLESRMQTRQVDDKTMLRLADAYFKSGMLDQADSIFATHLAKSDDSDIFLLWARVLDQLGRMDEAIQKFEFALQYAQQAGENQYAILKHRGSFYCNCENYVSAAQDLERIRQMCLPSIDRKVWHQLAISCYMIDQNEKALQLLDQLIAVDDSEPDYFHDRGKILYALDKYGAALQSFQYAMQREYYSSSRVWVIKAHIKLKQYDAALKAIDESVDYYVNPGQFYYYRAVCAYEREDFEAAKTEIEQCLENDPHDAIFQRFAGYVYRALEDEENALKYFSMYRDEEEVDVYNGWAASQYCLEQGRLKQSIAHLEFMHTIDDDPEIVFALAETYAWAGNWRKALKAIETYFKVIDESDPEFNKAAYYLRGKIKYYYHSSPKNALQDLSKACEIDICERAYYFLSMAYFDARDIPAAKKHIQTAIARDDNNPDFHKFSEAIEKYENLPWLTRKFIKSKAVEMIPPEDFDTMYLIGGLPDFVFN